MRIIVVDVCVAHMCRVGVEDGCQGHMKRKWAGCVTEWDKCVTEWCAEMV